MTGEATAFTLPSQRPHVLVVDDDDRLRGLLQRYLQGQGFLVAAAAHAGEAVEMLEDLTFDVMILDDMMPGETGFALARRLRGTDERDAALGRIKDIPILLLTARGEIDDKIEGLETGADDYLTKPFEPRELLLRINAIMRRAPKKMESHLVRLGRWAYDPLRDELKSLTETIRLTDMEAGLMRMLAAEPGTAFSREALAETSKGVINDRTIDVQVTRLRRKIEEDARNPRYLVTVRGAGYMLLPDAGE